MTVVRSVAEKIYDQAVGFANKIVGNREAAEDLATEAIYQLLRVEARLVERQFDEISVRQYFYRILRNCCYKYLSKERKTLELVDEDEVLDEPTQMPGDKLDLSEALGTLDDATRACLLMLAMGYNRSTIAAKLEVTPGAVTSRFRRSRKKLASLGLTFSNSQLSVDQIQSINIPAKADGDWFNIYRLAELTGRNCRTVKSRVYEIAKKYKIKSERRRNEMGQTTDHWPSVILTYLTLELLCYPEGGDWYTVGQLKKVCQQPSKWINLTLRQIKAIPELRRASNGKIHPHYSPETLPLLMNRKKAGDWVTRMVIKRALNCTDDAKIKRGLAKIGAICEKRDGAQGRSRDHYDPKVIDQLRELWG